ncbi:NAD(P)/FAD-dependent oxidoreductase [uncultured Phenylobacterium sp.]|uniref:flavin-containing monooxygenase n=1 Tax=uncultured Phenylobacterium sp. TaxID=349273 RepID=UPI0025E42CE3|nr:NAD(P)/FAD-dependent oxidoreductase [uncultured Phenylobacterium sp.]
MAENKTSERAAVSKAVDAVVVGAGFGGLYMTHRLRQAGLSVQGIEAGYDVGGTWFWNRYPGARCDIPSLLYSYTFDDGLRDEWRWSEKYAPQPEILAYANHVANRFDLRPNYLFETKVIRMAFDEVKQRWLVETDRGDRIEARWVVTATGCLSQPKAVDIQGADSFEGESYSTSRWPHGSIDFTGKRVAMIGTGSSAIQSTPLIAEHAAKVTVFQRTPNFSLPAKNRELTDQEIAEFMAGYPAYKEALATGSPGIPLPPEGWAPSEAELRQAAEHLWSGDGLLSLAVLPNLTRDERVNKIGADYVRAKIKEIVKDPELADKLTPKDFPLGTKRACVDTDYYATFNRDNVELVDLRETPLVEVNATGVKTTGAQYDVDVIVYATGFDAMTGALLNMDIRGRQGRALREAWADGPKTLLGLQIAGFPNLFTVTGPGSPSVLSNMITSCEQHVDWIMGAIEHMRKSGKSTMEPKPEAQEAWVRHVNEQADQTLFPKANSWYMGANVPGKPRVFMPYVGEGYKVRCDEVAAKGYEGFELA